MAMAVRRASTELLAQRFVHLHIVPRPSNLSESREVYRILQRFGAIDKYYNLQFEYHSPAPNSALLIYRDPSAAQQALDASPIRFALERTAFTPHTAFETDEYTPSTSSEDDVSPLEDDTPLDTQPSTSTPPTTGIDDILRPSPLLTRTSPTPNPIPPPSPSSPAPLPFAPQPPPQKTESRWFQVTIDRSRAVHMDYVERQPFWKQFEPMKSVAQLDLKRVVPHVGLSDVSKRPPHAYRTPNRVLRGMSEHLAYGQESLVRMWEEGGMGGEDGKKGRG